MFVKSMTGYGKYISDDSAYILDMELKAVNHKYLDINIRAPKIFNEFELEIRNIIKDKIKRGKLDLYINFKNLAPKEKKLIYNKNILSSYLDIAKDISEDFDIKNSLGMEHIFRLPEVINDYDFNELDDEIENLLYSSINKLIDNFDESRIKEGNYLKEDILLKIESVKDYVEKIKEFAPELESVYREKLNEKLKSILENVVLDESRIACEIALYSEKISIDEELVRLSSHLESFKDVLLEGGAVGKKLDFISQELNREANTVLSKTPSVKIADLAINIKTDIDKIREQVQNLE